MKWISGLSLLAAVYLVWPISAVRAAVDPLAVANNRFGVHIISATPSEASEAANLVNSNGDWGYITFVISSADRSREKWQTFFDDLRKRHLIPIVRLSTKVEGTGWQRPKDGDALFWADFLGSLIWPVKNRYVVIYNEPNHAAEWGGAVDPVSYAKELDKTITALKLKSADFFVLNAGLDASAPRKLPVYEDEQVFLRKMEQAVPGIFGRLDGWVSHSYPNPGFSAPPTDSGRGSVRTWQWELELLRSFGAKKGLPVFITETGWQHAEGINYNPALPGSDTVADYYRQAFENAWVNDRIVAVTPFLLNYQEAPFDHFSFKRLTDQSADNRPADAKVLGIESPDFYPQYQLLKNLPKNTGRPVQEDRAELVENNFYDSIPVGEPVNIMVKVKNTGQSIWGETGTVRLIPIAGGSELGIKAAVLPEGVRVEPGREYTFNIGLKAPSLGTYQGTLALFVSDKQFDSAPFIFTTTVKSPASISIKSRLPWGKDSSGKYLLSVSDGTSRLAEEVVLGPSDQSGKSQLHSLLPDRTYQFTLSKSLYKAKTITARIDSGANVLDFGELKPDWLAAIFNPKKLWKLLPFSS